MMRVALILLVALLHSAVVLWGVLDHARLIRSGTEVVLKATAVDPRDLLRGHYATLRLAISEVPRGLPGMLPGALPLAGSPIWVILAPGADGVWQATGIAAADPDGVAIRGQLLSEYGDTLSIEFDIARYYAPRDRALVLEDAMRRDSVAVILALGPDGQAALRGVVIDGVRHMETLF